MGDSFLKRLINRETISYLIFGVLTTVVDWAVYTLCRFNGTDYMAATVIAWCAAVVFAFFTNKIWVFESRGSSPLLLIREFSSFVSCRLATGLMNLAGMKIFVGYMKINDFLSKLVLSVLVILLNYIFSKLFIFKKRK